MGEMGSSAARSHAPKVRRTRWQAAIDRLEAGGKSIAAVDMLPGGGVRILLGEPADLSMARGEPNEWDEVLPGGA